MAVFGQFGKGSKFKLSSEEQKQFAELIASLRRILKQRPPAPPEGM